MVRAVFFDLDGTLLDTLPDLAAALNHLLAEEGIPEVSPSSLRPRVAEGAAGMLRFALGRDPKAEQIQRFRELYRDRYLCLKTRPFGGIEKLISELERSGIAWGVVTNKLKAMTEPLLSRLGLLRRAAAVVSVDECRCGKPDPSPLLLACARAGVVPSEAIYVGDAPKDIEAGRRAGMRTAVALWGYLPEAPPCAEWKGDLLLHRPEDLLPWIRSFACPRGRANRSPAG